LGMEIAITSIIVLAAILTVSVFAGSALIRFGFFDNTKYYD